MSKIEYKSYITRSDLRQNPNKIFVFGDNDMRKGYGGQAKEMRGEPNAIGIRVKKAPSMSEISFYNDNEFYDNGRKINEDLKYLIRKSENKVIVFPANGIGTGMALLDKKAPNTFALLNKLLFDYFGIQNGYNIVKRKSTSCKCKIKQP